LANANFEAEWPTFSHTAIEFGSVKKRTSVVHCHIASSCERGKGAVHNESKIFFRVDYQFIYALRVGKVSPSPAVIASFVTGIVRCFFEILR